MSERELAFRVFDTPGAMAAAAAAEGADAIRAVLAKREACRLILATGASQLGVLATLAAAPGIDWARVDGFHLDEYLGLPAEHPASFRGYLRDRFRALLPTPLRSFHELDGEVDPAGTCRLAGAALSAAPVDVALVGIGENGHLAFNDPPADFETEQPFLVVELDEACRRQQLGEGWFPALADVPTRAISMSCRQILKSRKIVCSVPDRRKAEAVYGTIMGPVTPDVPASILQRHDDVTLFLDEAAASELPS